MPPGRFAVMNTATAVPVSPKIVVQAIIFVSIAGLRFIYAVNAQALEMGLHSSSCAVHGLVEVLFTVSAVHLPALDLESLELRQDTLHASITSLFSRWRVNADV